MGHEFSDFTAVAIQAEICSIAACTSTSRSLSPFQVSALHPVVTSAMGGSGQSSAQRHPGILRVSDLNQGGNVPPPIRFLLILFALYLGLLLCKFPQQIYL